MKQQQQVGGMTGPLPIMGWFIFLGMQQVHFMAHATSHRFKPILVYAANADNSTNP